MHCASTWNPAAKFPTIASGAKWCSNFQLYARIVKEIIIVTEVKIVEELKTAKEVKIVKEVKVAKKVKTV